MKQHKKPGRGVQSGVERMPTGIGGFDELLGGGLPRHRTTLLGGGPGCGKTIFAMQSLVTGLRQGEPGIFVAFEESPTRVLANSSSFGWELASHAKRDLCLIDARIGEAVVRGGDFDLLGLFATIDLKRRRIGARRIVFDGLDVLLNHLSDPALARREVYRLTEWLAEQELTAIITSKTDATGTVSDKDVYLQFVADCVVILQHRLIGSLPLRSLRVTKCRGLPHATGEVPFAITLNGIKVVSYGSSDVRKVSSRRLSSGIVGLDEMLLGGYFEGTTVLVSGSPGTAKSTVAGAFIEASAKGGHSCLYVTFDEPAANVVRNMTSVNIDLAPHVKSGRLQIMSERNVEKSPVEHVAHIVELIEERGVTALVIDPMSSLTAFGEAPIAEEMVLRLLDYARSRGVTVLCTTMLAGGNGLLEETGTGVSTIPDTWIHLSNVIENGERNRALTIVKSRGVGHSKQVRELVLADDGVTLGRAYSGSGELVTGPLRRHEEKRRDESRRRDATSAIARRAARIDVLQAEVIQYQGELNDMAVDEVPPAIEPEKKR